MSTHSKQKHRVVYTSRSATETASIRNVHMIPCLHLVSSSLPLTFVMMMMMMIIIIIIIVVIHIRALVCL